MDDDKRQNVMSNISEDVAKLLTEECVRLGKRKLYEELFCDAEWCQWRYSDSTPETVEEYALDPAKGTIMSRTIPDYASKIALVDFFRDELMEDLMECRERFGERKEADGE